MLVQLDDLIAKKDLAKKLGVSERSLSRWAKYGIDGIKLERIKLGSLVYYDKQSVQVFIERLKQR